MLAQVASNTVPKVDFTALAVCRGLGRNATTNVMAITSLQKRTAGETIFWEGDAADSVFEVVSGTLRLHKLLPDGRRQVTGFLCAGHLIGLAPEGTWVYTAEAITDVTLCRYRRPAFERLIDTVPGFARRVLTVTSHELRVAQDQMLLLGRKTAAERVASFLLLMADQQGCEEISVPMGRNDIADYLGLTVETVCRTLTQLKRSKLIELPTHGHIVILNRAELEELAAGGTDLDL
ncbi:MAG TPA: helix-turn-helix domain-containing protein [Stellaceae bacterium]|nr:helix-turn-helix domain-containing protein [Stellaceae bacterium]